MQSVEISSGDMVNLDEWDQRPAYKEPNWEISRCKVWKKPEPLSLGLDALDGVYYIDNMVHLGPNLLLDIGQDNDSMTAGRAGVGVSSNHDNPMERVFASQSQHGTLMQHLRP